MERRLFRRQFSLMLAGPILFYFGCYLPGALNITLCHIHLVLVPLLLNINLDFSIPKNDRQSP